MKNRFILNETAEGVKEVLKEEKAKLQNMYADGSTTIEDREKQDDKVKDLEQRYKGLKAQIDELDEQAQAKQHASTSRS